MAKYVVICGGIISGAGKGVSAASIGLLLRLRNHNVTYIKLDPYLNVNAGIMSPVLHGEVFICDDGTECDLDLSHMEQIMGANMSKDNIATSGSLYKELIDEQESGKHLGCCLQLSPHLTNKVQQRLLDLGQAHDVVIAEIGGTVGDAESFAFFEAMREFKQKHKDDVLVVMVSPILWFNTIKEFKTKPLQNSVRELQRHGLQPDVLLCRADRPVPDKILEKVATFCNVPSAQVFVAPDVETIYQVPLEFYNRNVDDTIVDLLRLPRSRCSISKYREVVEKYVNDTLPTVEIGVFGKYEGDGVYISLQEALLHGGIANDVKVSLRWIKSEELEKYNGQRGLHKYFDGLHGVIVPGGFDNRGVEGKIKAVQYVRERKIPFLGICLGLQCAVIEFARNVLGLPDANSLEFNPTTTNPVVHFVEGQEGLLKKSGTMRLGAYDCELVPNSLVHQLYGEKLIKERHRHRYEVNPRYVAALKTKGFQVSGTNPRSGLIEMMELDGSVHPFFVGTQSHPEFRSRLTMAAPLFRGLIGAAKIFGKIS